MSADRDATKHVDEVEVRVLDYVLRELVDPGARLDRNTDLLTGVILDSMGVLRLATFVGETFGIQIQPADFVIENFRSVAAVADYVGRVRSRTGGGDGPARP